MSDDFSASSSSMFEEGAMAMRELLFSAVPPPPYAPSSGSSGTGYIRVLGVGIAIFVFLLVLAASLMVCVFGSRTKSPGVYYLISTLVFGIVALILFASPRGTLVTPPYGYNQTIVPMSVVMALLIFGIISAGVGLLIFEAAPRHYARPLRQDLDVLGIRGR